MQEKENFLFYGKQGLAVLLCLTLLVSNATPAWAHGTSELIFMRSALQMLQEGKALSFVGRTTRNLPQDLINGTASLPGVRATINNAATQALLEHLNLPALPTSLGNLQLEEFAFSPESQEIARAYQNTQQLVEQGKLSIHTDNREQMLHTLSWAENIVSKAEQAQQITASDSLLIKRFLQYAQEVFADGGSAATNDINKLQQQARLLYHYLLNGPARTLVALAPAYRTTYPQATQNPQAAVLQMTYTHTYRPGGPYNDDPDDFDGPDPEGCLTFLLILGVLTMVVGAIVTANTHAEE